MTTQALTEERICRLKFIALETYYWLMPNNKQDVMWD